MKPELTEAEYLQQEDEGNGGAAVWIVASALTTLFILSIVAGAVALGGA